MNAHKFRPQFYLLLFCVICAPVVCGRYDVSIERIAYSSYTRNSSDSFFLVNDGFHVFSKTDRLIHHYKSEGVWESEVITDGLGDGEITTVLSGTSFYVFFRSQDHGFMAHGSLGNWQISETPFADNGLVSMGPDGTLWAATTDSEISSIYVYTGVWQQLPIQIETGYGIGLSAIEQGAVLLYQRDGMLHEAIVEPDGTMTERMLAEQIDSRYQLTMVRGLGEDLHLVVYNRDRIEIRYGMKPTGSDWAFETIDRPLSDSYIDLCILINRDGSPICLISQRGVAILYNREGDQWNNQEIDLPVDYFRNYQFSAGDELCGLEVSDAMSVYRYQNEEWSEDIIAVQIDPAHLRINHSSSGDLTLFGLSPRVAAEWRRVEGRWVHQQRNLNNWATSFDEFDFEVGEDENYHIFTINNPYETLEFPGLYYHQLTQDGMSSSSLLNIYATDPICFTTSKGIRHFLFSPYDKDLLFDLSIRDNVLYLEVITLPESIYSRSSIRIRKNTLGNTTMSFLTSTYVEKEQVCSLYYSEDHWGEWYFHVYPLEDVEYFYDGSESFETSFDRFGNPSIFYKTSIDSLVMDRIVETDRMNWESPPDFIGSDFVPAVVMDPYDHPIMIAKSEDSDYQDQLQLVWNHGAGWERITLSSEQIPNPHDWTLIAPSRDVQERYFILANPMGDILKLNIQKNAPWFELFLWNDLFESGHMFSLDYHLQNDAEAASYYAIVLCEVSVGEQSVFFTMPSMQPIESGLTPIRMSVAGGEFASGTILSFTVPEIDQSFPNIRFWGVLVDEAWTRLETDVTGAICGFKPEN